MSTMKLYCPVYGLQYSYTIKSSHVTDFNLNVFVRKSEAIPFSDYLLQSLFISYKNSDSSNLAYIKYLPIASTESRTYYIVSGATPAKLLSTLAEWGVVYDPGTYTSITGTAITFTLGRRWHAKKVTKLYVPQNSSAVLANTLLASANGEAKRVYQR